MYSQKEEEKLFLVTTAELGVHDHPCVIYESAEELAHSFVPYLRSGLLRGQRCIYFVDENTPEFVIDSMQADGFDLRPYIDSGAFFVITTKDAHIKDQLVDEMKMVSYWKNAINEAHEAGFDGLRAAVEMTWALSGHSGREILCPYESRLNAFMNDHNVTVACQYHRHKFTADKLKTVIQTHPIVIAENEILRNPNCVEPEKFVESGADLEMQVILDNRALTNKLMQSNRVLEQTNQALELSLAAERKAQEELKSLAGERHTREVAQAKAYQYRVIAEAIPQIVWTANGDGEVDYLNQRWYQHTEKYPENSLGSGWLQEIHADDRAQFSARWKAAISCSKPFEISARLRMFNDEYVWTLFRAVPIEDSENGSVKWFGTGTDIQNQKDS
jgi:PAS domain-containing protein